jgi:FtsH-binding integral membrane protein
LPLFEWAREAKIGAPVPQKVALSLQRTNRLGETVKKVKIFANYSIPLVWGVVGLLVGCVGAYFALAYIWMHAIMRPEDVTPADGTTVMILSLVTGIFIGSALLYASAQTRWQGAKSQS